MRTRLTLLAVLLLAGLALWWLLRDQAEAQPEGNRRPGPTASPAPAGSRRAPRPVAPGPLEADEDPAARPRSARPDAGASTLLAATAPDAGAGAAALALLHDFLRANAAAAERYVDRYCEEARPLAAARAFSPSPRTRDAALYLGVRTDWEDGRVGLLHLPGSLTGRMRDPPQAWRSLGAADLAGLDFSWMRELLAYDFWSLSADGPLDAESRAPALAAPLPDFVLLQSWAKLRLVKGRAEGDLAQATLEVRHLGSLIASTGTFLGELIRAALYGLERAVWADAGLQPPDPPPSAAEALRQRHALFAGVYFLYPGVPRAVRERALGCIPTRCSALQEAVTMVSAMREAAPEAPDVLDWLLAQAPCDPALAARMARAPPLPVEQMRDLVNGRVSDVEAAMRLLLDGGT